MADVIPETLFGSHVQCVRTVVGAERFDASTPDQTLRPSGTAVTDAADVATLKADDSGAGNEPNAEPETAATILAPDSGANCGAAIPAASPDGFARSSEYTLSRRVGKGGMGEIFLAGQIALRRDVAVKKIIPEHLEKGSGKKMEDAFISEALVTGYLDHPNIVPVHALGRDDAGNWFFSMKMVRGIEWRLLLHPEAGEWQGRPGPDTVGPGRPNHIPLDIDDPARRAAHLEENLRILLSVCNAVAFAHSKHIIHRDLKPENVMVGAFGEVLAMDWGLAADVSDEPPPPGHPERRVPARGETGVGGTPSYMAPEQFYFDENGQPSGAHLGLWTDVFLLGAMLYELLSGRAPYIGRSVEDTLRKVAGCAPPALPESAPAELAAVCRKALSKNPNDRYPDALAFQKAVQEFLTHREAAAIAAKADHEAKTSEIPNLARAVVLYDQALELWPENAAMAASVKTARASLAQKEGRVRWIRRSLYAAVASIVIGLTLGFFWIRAEQQKAVAEKLRADANEKTALAARNDAQAKNAELIESQRRTEAQRVIAVENERKATEQKRIAENALKEQRRLSFEAVFRNAEADDQMGESAKVIAALEPYVSEAELAQHPMRSQAAKLIEKARDGFKRFAAFAEQMRNGEQSAALDLGQGVMLEVVLIPAGKFMMGSPENETTGSHDQMPHEVRITKSFYMGKYHVTQEQFMTVTGKKTGLFKGKPKNPVETVNWFEAVAFCEKLNKQSGDAKLRFALPTEAQWEYACRAGTQTRFYFGDDEGELERYAWYEKNAGAGTAGVGTHPVGEKKPNAFGLYDMHGNIFDWCMDWYDSTYYTISPKDDPAGPANGELIAATNSIDRVLRGGSWGSPARECQSSYRGYIAPEDRSPGGGIRVVLPVPAFKTAP